MDQLKKVAHTEEILKELNRCINEKEPFSVIRFGDAIYGILASFLCPGLIKVGKWHGRRGQKMSNNILGQLTIPPDRRMALCKRIVSAANQANYVDSYDAYKLVRNRRLGILARSWKEIHEGCGITNENYCSCFVHYFSIVDGDYNLFDVMKGRRIFCITSRMGCLDQLKEKSGAAVIDGYRIPRRGRKAKHYREHFQEAMRICKGVAKKYDLVLVGGGFLGKVYCDQVRRFGGRSFDAGRLFDFWSNVRTIDSAPKRFLIYDSGKMLCRRKKHPSKPGAKGVW